MPSAHSVQYSKEGEPLVPALEFVGITKRFGDTVANDDITVAFEAGQVHAVLGENGAGKTTIMKIAAGLHRPDSGEVRVKGEAHDIANPAQALSLGIGMVHQHFTLVPNLTVAENVILGLKSDRARPAIAARQIRELSDAYGIPVDPEAKVESLTAGEMQRVEIVKLLYRNADILILDEPTALLSPAEADRLFTAFRELAEDGKAIAFITHKLREVFAVADRISILRKGRLEASMNLEDATPEGLSRLMVGEDANVTLGDSLAVQVKGRGGAAAGDVELQAERDLVRLAVQNVSVHDRYGRRRLRDLSLEVRAGEIFGVAGVEGNGQSALAQALVGLLPISAGSIDILGVPIAGMSHRAISSLGVAFIPEDRQTEGLIPDLSLRENLLLREKIRHGVSRWGLIRSGASRRETQELIDNFEIVAPSTEVPAADLSGGNQQKLVLARELRGNPSVIVASQATRGLDLKATSYVHEALIRHASDGAGVIFISSDLDEVLSVSTRVGVLFKGRFAGQFDTNEAERAVVGALMTGAGDQRSVDADSAE